MKAICFVNTTATWGGGEKWHFEMAMALAQRGYAVKFVCQNGGALHQKLIGEAGVRVFALRRARSVEMANVVLLARLSRWLRGERVEVVLLNGSADLKIGGVAAKFARVRQIIYRRGLAVPIRDTVLNRWLFGAVVTRVIANSEATKHTLLQNNARLFPPEGISVIYNGLDLVRYDQTPAAPIYKRSHPDEVVLGNAGRLTAQKGQHYLIELAARLKERRQPFRVLIAGSGELEGELKALAEERGVAAEVVFLGFVGNIKSFMESIDVLVLTSLWEGFGFVLAEAMASSKPCLAFDISSNPELIREGKNGYLVPLDDVPTLAQRAEALMTSPDLRRRMGALGRALVEQKFTLAVNTALVERLFAASEQP